MSALAYDYCDSWHSYLREEEARERSEERRNRRLEAAAELALEQQCRHVIAHEELTAMREAEQRDPPEPLASEEDDRNHLSTWPR